jgi:hypothetical protein
MNAAAIAAALGDARREGCTWRCRCPLHGGRSLLLRDGAAGCVLVTCWDGCWPTLWAGGIKNLVLPPVISHVAICVDHDAVAAAAVAAAAQCLANGHRLRIALPPKPGADFNDILLDCSPARINGVSHASARTCGP